MESKKLNLLFRIGNKIAELSDKLEGSHHDVFDYMLDDLNKIKTQK